LNDEVVIFCY